jgi:serine/threonine-protein kinase HipA
MKQRSIDILFKDKFAGTLIETASGGTCFTYDQAWTNSIACCLPIARREHEWSQGVHPFFQNLGPEGWLREQQARAGNIVEDDDIGLLLRYGADCIGAVSVRPKEEIVPVIKGTEAITNYGRTLSGVQKKLLVVKDKDVAGQFHPAPSSGPAPYIAKFNSTIIPNLVRNEALSLRWTAFVLGKDKVNEFTHGHVSAINETALIVTRFDRGPDGEKLRSEDFAQILCKPKGHDYNGKFNASYEEIISKHSARPAIDLERFYRQLIASILIGNCDAHLKNFSLLETPSGLRLSPAYDVVNTVFYGSSYKRNLALSIGGKEILHDEADSTLFLKFGKEIGLPGKVIEQSFTDLKRQVLKAAPIIRPPEAEPPEGFVTRFEQIVREACLRILGI